VAGSREVSEVSVGGVSLIAPRSWTFFPFENLILARTDARLGTLQISLAFREQASRPITHESCLRVALEFANVESSKTFDRQTSGDGARLCGSLTFGSSEHLGGVFYACDDHGLIVAVYRASAPGAETEVVECARILESASISGRV